MPSWYDIVGLDSRSLELCNGLDQSMERILSLMEDEVIPNANDGHCVDYSRIVLAGFSQGGALALYTGMASTRKAINSQPSNKPQGLGLAGILIMSGYLPRSKSFAIAPGSESTPILHCHGKQDSVVPVEATELSRNHVTSLMEKMGGKKESYEVKLYSGLDHSVSMDELDDVVTFLRRVLPPTETSAPNDAVIGDPSVMSVRQLRGAIKQAGLEEQAKGMFEKSELINLLQQYLNQKK